MKNLPYMVRGWVVASLFLLTALPLQAQTYYLPKTTLNIHLLIEKQTYTPGRFSRYAEKYLRVSGVSQDQQVSHRIIGCDVTTLGVRDTTKCFTLRLKGKSESADIRLSDDGVLLSINTDPLTPSSSLITQHAALNTQPSSLNTQHASLLSAEVLAAGSTAKMAELTAQQITELRERRQLLATGEADNMPQDERQLQLMLSELDSQCNALTSLFTGTVRRDTTAQEVTLCPDKEMEREVVFRLSRRLGLVDKDDLAGAPYYITLKNLHPAEKVPLPENKKGEGLYANVPGTVQLTLQQEDQPLATFQVPMAQFGFVELREASLFKRYHTTLQLHPATGAVVSCHYTE